MNQKELVGREKEKIPARYDFGELWVTSAYMSRPIASASRKHLQLLLDIAHITYPRKF